MTQPRDDVREALDQSERDVAVVWSIVRRPVLGRPTFKVIEGGKRGEDGRPATHS
jgi:hypothetical protein